MKNKGTRNSDEHERRTKWKKKTGMEEEEENEIVRAEGKEMRGRMTGRKAWLAVRFTNGWRNPGADTLTLPFPLLTSARTGTTPHDREKQNKDGGSCEKKFPRRKS